MGGWVGLRNGRVEGWVGRERSKTKGFIKTKSLKGGVCGLALL